MRIRYTCRNQQEFKIYKVEKGKEDEDLGTWFGKFEQVMAELHDAYAPEFIDFTAKNVIYRSVFNHSSKKLSKKIRRLCKK
ncbi:MAG: hypothetical protein RLZZ74_3412 [Cyanobacteriota bacterium]|jgi:hypothetical protein